MKIDKFDHEYVVFDNSDFGTIENQLGDYDKLETLRIQVNEGLEEAFNEMNSLKKQLSQNEGDMLIDQCKTTILEVVTSQFGLASMFIECKDGGNVTTTHNFEKGVVSTEADQRKRDAFVANNDGSKSWDTVRKDGGYDKPLPSKRKAAFQEQEVIIDAYTLKPLPKDGRSHLDHIVSAKEIESSPANSLHLTPEERAKMATSDTNLAWTDSRINQSKGELPMSEWTKKKDKKSGQTNEERFEIKNTALEEDLKARKAIKKEVNTAAFKKYSTELLKTGGKDAANMAAYSAIGVVMREFVQATFEVLKETFANRGNESLKEVFIRFKNRMAEVVSSLKSKWKDILKGSIEGGLTAFFSNLLVFVVNLFATTLKKIVHMIRAGFVSLVQALKILTNPPAGMSTEEARYQAVKIFTAGLIGAASLGLSAAIEKFLQAIPGLQPIMMFPIPSLGGVPRTVSDILAITLSSLLGGLLTTITIYYMDKFRREGAKSKLQIKMVYQSGIVVDYKIAQSWFVLNDAYNFLAASVVDTAQTIYNTKQEIGASLEMVGQANTDYSSAIDRLKQARQKRNEQLGL